MNANHSPPMKFPVKILKKPKIIKNTPRDEPILLVVYVAFFMSPVEFQMIARSILPPSSGKPGNKLNIINARFINTQYFRMPINGMTGKKLIKNLLIIRKRSARAPEQIGPATAILISDWAVVGSSVISATPPKINSVIPFMGILFFFGNQGMTQFVK